MYTHNYTYIKLNMSIHRVAHIMYTHYYTYIKLNISMCSVVFRVSILIPKLVQVLLAPSKFVGPLIWVSPTRHRPVLYTVVFKVISRNIAFNGSSKTI